MKLNTLISLAIFFFCASSFMIHHEINLFAACVLSIVSVIIALQSSRVDKKSLMTVSAYSNNDSVKLYGKYVNHVSENQSGADANSYYFDLSKDKNTSKTSSDSEIKE